MDFAISAIISIHAPRAGCDLGWGGVSMDVAISIHAPRAGCDPLEYFQQLARVSISIHAPRAGCDREASALRAGAGISIHAPRAGCDRPGAIQAMPGRPDFNPRTPCGVRRGSNGVCARLDGHFNPRTPCGVRQLPDYVNQASKIFQSTHPVRGATIAAAGKTPWMQISIHAPRAGCDFDSTWLQLHTGEFQSTHPVRGATYKDIESFSATLNFNPRTPCGVRPYSRTASTAY